MRPEDDRAEERGLKRRRTEGAGTPSECAICLQGEPDRRLLPHGCDTCAPEAWRVCEECERNLVSRSCPVCQGDYRGLELFAHQRLEEELLAGRELSEMQRFVCRKVLFLSRLEMLTFSNTAVWLPEQHLLCFSLPVDTTVEPSVIEYLRGRIRPLDDATEAALREGRFLFTNRVWDAIVAADSEEPEEPPTPGRPSAGDSEPSDEPSLHTGDDGTDEGDEDGSEEEEARPDSGSQCRGSRELIAWALGELARPGAELFTSQSREDLALLVESTLLELGTAEGAAVDAKVS